jgi:hypothetical protein
MKILALLPISILALAGCGRSTTKSIVALPVNVDLSFHTHFASEAGKWEVGQRVIFLPESSPVVRASWRGQYPGFNGLFDEIAGRVGQVLASKRDENGFRTVSVRMEGSSKIFRGYEGNGLSDSVTFIDDKAILAVNYETAKRLIGRTLWVKGSSLDPYDPKSNDRKSENNPLCNSNGVPDTDVPGRLEPVQVTDVLLSESSLAPLRLIFKWNGCKSEKYFKDVHFGSPDIDRQYWSLYRLADQFLDVDPSSLHWTETVLRMIKERSIVIGMTADQVIFSWGEPTQKNRTTTANGVSEQWVYKGSNYVYMENGVMTALQGPG